MLASLRCFVVSLRIDFQIVLITFKAFHSLVDSYTAELLFPDKPRCAATAQEAGRAPPAVTAQSQTCDGCGTASTSEACTITDISLKS